MAFTSVAYKVTESLAGQPTRVYNVVVPHTATAGTVDLAALTPV